MSQTKKITQEAVENQVRTVMAMNRHGRRAWGKRNHTKIPSDKNYNFVDGKLTEK